MSEANLLKVDLQFFAEKSYKATVGVDEFYYMVLEGGAAPNRVKFLQNITVEMPQEAVRAYGDNVTAEIAVSSGNTTVTSAFHKVPKEDKQILFGLESDTEGLTAYGSNDTPPYVGVIFCKTRNDGGKEWVGLTKGMFMRPNITGATKEEGTEFANEEVSAEFMERDVDGFDDEKTALFGEDAKGETAMRDALFQKIFGTVYPTTTTTTTTVA